jgi:hypothetical protein
MDGLTCGDDDRCAELAGESVLFDPAEVCGAPPSE